MIKGDLYLKELNRENQLFILNPSSRGEHSMLAFLVIDTKSYRLLSINAYNDIFIYTTIVPLSTEMCQGKALNEMRFEA